VFQAIFNASFAHLADICMYLVPVNTESLDIFGQLQLTVLCYCILSVLYVLIMFDIVFTSYFSALVVANKDTY